MKLNHGIPKPGVGSSTLSRATFLFVDAGDAIFLPSRFVSRRQEESPKLVAREYCG